MSWCDKVKTLVKFSFFSGMMFAKGKDRDRR